jgi:hypothetical protein
VMPLLGAAGFGLYLDRFQRLAHALSFETATIGDARAKRADESDRWPSEVDPRLLDLTAPVRRLKSELPIGNGDDGRRHSKCEPSATVSGRHGHPGGPSVPTQLAVTCEARADSGTAFGDPVAAAAFRTPLGHPRQVADEVLDSVGRSLDQFGDGDSPVHLAIVPDPWVRAHAASAATAGDSDAPRSRLLWVGAGEAPGIEATDTPGNQPSADRCTRPC